VVRASKTGSLGSRAAVFTFLLVCLHASPVIAAAPSLSVETLNVRQQGTITFSVFAAGATVIPSGADLVSADIPGDKYKVVVDLNSIRPGRFGTFTAELYVQTGDSLTVSTYKFMVTGSSIGVFLDVDDRITLHVQAGGQDTKGYLNLPLHSGGQVDLLSTDPITQPIEIKLGQDRGAQLAVKNKLENLKLVITHIELEDSCAQCWNVSAEPFPVMSVDENGSATVPIKATPKTLSALAASAFALKSDQAHDTFLVYVTYHAAYGGQERKQKFSIPIRFSPSLWTLLAAVLIGAGLGFLANVVLDATSRASWRAVGITAAKSLVLVVVVEIVALAMAAYGTKVVLFTFDLDPRQFLPAIVIGVLVSGGGTVVSFVKQVFGTT
jgi:hypothetical protein